jgi:hypothetical protein
MKAQTPKDKPTEQLKSKKEMDDALHLHTSTILSFGSNKIDFYLE